MLTQTMSRRIPLKHVRVCAIWRQGASSQYSTAAGRIVRAVEAIKLDGRLRRVSSEKNNSLY